jgi:hypothetical protein
LIFDSSIEISILIGNSMGTMNLIRVKMIFPL